MENPIKMDDLGVPLFLEIPCLKQIHHMFEEPSSGATLPKTNSYNSSPLKIDLPKGKYIVFQTLILHWLC